MIAIDPNYDKKSGGNGCAYFHDGKLVATFFQRPKLPIRFLDERHSCVIIEKPHFTEGQSGGKDPNVILELGWQGALLAGMYAGASKCPVLPFTTTQWKGSQHKPHMHLALWDVLSQKERVALGGARTLQLIREAADYGARTRWSRHSARGRAGWYAPGNGIPDLLDASALGCVAIGRLAGAVLTRPGRT